MADLNSTDYYRSRERRERELAAAALDPAIASIHLDMAVRYAALVADADAKGGWAIRARFRSVIRNATP